jgi:spore coat protein U-like protein
VIVHRSRSAGQQPSRRLRGAGRVGRRACLAVVALLISLDAAAAIDCTVSTVGVAFGEYDPLSPTPTDSTGDVTIVCVYISGGAQQVSYSVQLSSGSSGSYLQRQMQAAPSVLRYNLFTDAARSAVWGDGSGGTTVANGSVTIGPGVGNGRREDARSIYGRIPARQDALFGNYADSIIVTLVF